MGSDSDRKRKKKSKKSKRRKKSYDSDSSSTSSSSSSAQKTRKLKKKLKKKEKPKHKTDSEDDLIGPAIPTDLPTASEDNSSKLKPMTKEEWEKRQQEVKRVFDSESGRYRLVRGDGEIIEEIVSKDRHKEINKQATCADGNYFQQRTALSRK